MKTLADIIKARAQADGLANAEYTVQPLDLRRPAPREFSFDCGPDTITAKLQHFNKPDETGHSAYISFSGKGPKGGYVYGPSHLEREAMIELSAMIDEAMGWPHRCRSCGRDEADCSAEPCAAVQQDRAA